MRGILLVDLFRNEIMIFEILHSVLGEIFMAVTLVTQGARVVKDESSQFDFLPGWGRRVPIQLHDCLCDPRDYDACILLTTQIDGLVL